MTIIIIILTILNFIIFKNFKFISKKFKIIDYPDNERKIHKNIAYPIGGIIFFINIVILFIFNNYFDLLNLNFIKFNDSGVFFIGFVLIFFIGLLDDKINLNANIKLLLVLASISIVLILNPDNQLKNLYFQLVDFNLSTGKFSFFFTLLCYLLLINALNMFDGINLQLGLYTFSGLIYLFLFSQNYNFLLLLIFLFFFLVWNFKNNVFMGDSGSLLIGYFFSYIFIFGYNNNYFLNVEQIFIFMAIPGIDMFRLFLIRIYNKKNPFQGDKNHIHHVLLKIYGEKKAILYVQIIYLLPLLISFFSLKISLASIVFLYTLVIINHLLKKK